MIPARGVLILLVAGALAGCSAHESPPPIRPTTGPFIAVRTETVELPSGVVRFDLYSPADARCAPLVVIAHGWLRTRANLAGWGRRLAEEGFLVAVPDLPTFSDHRRNARAVNELVAALCGESSQWCRVDPERIALVGHSTGGLCTLLAAVDNPNVKVWVGLDPVDRFGMGTAAAGKLRARAVVLRAPASRWNHNGNVVSIMHALPNGCADTLVPDAIHVDPEWPTDWRMEWAMGKTSAQRRDVFVRSALTALKAELGKALLASD